MSYFLEQYKKLMAMSKAAMRDQSNRVPKKVKAKSKLAEMFGQIGFHNPRFKLTLGTVVVPMVRGAAVKARKLAMRQAKRSRIDTRGYA